MRRTSVELFTLDIVREAITGRRTSFSSDYANYTDIFYHRSMEKDKLFVLNVWSSYDQKDIIKLDRSEINKPARVGVGS